MLDINEEIMKHHIKTHTQHSAEDDAAVTMLKSFLLSGGRINTKFDYNDKWPNTDGTFEFVSNPAVSRRPEQNFFVQIKGVHSQDNNDSGFKYSLKSLAFPAFIGSDCTLDPGILFVVVNPDIRGRERVFWKYMSVDFINSIDFNNESTTIAFSKEDEIINTDEGIIYFCKKLEKIIEHHLFVNRLSKNKFTIEDVKKVVKQCNVEIVESIDRFEILMIHGIMFLAGF